MRSTISITITENSVAKELKIIAKLLFFLSSDHAFVGPNDIVVAVKCTAPQGVKIVLHPFGYSRITIRFVLDLRFQLLLLTRQFGTVQLGLK